MDLDGSALVPSSESVRRGYTIFCLSLRLPLSTAMEVAPRFPPTEF
jgi:hypothetical protein